jgi:hypothetical protein
MLILRTLSASALTLIFACSHDSPSLQGSGLSSSSAPIVAAVASVPGVGDKAGWVEAGHYILVESGGNTFAFAIAGPGGTLENARALSLKVIANL